MRILFLLSTPTTPSFNILIASFFPSFAQQLIHRHITLITNHLQAIFGHFSVTSVTCFCKFPYRNYLPRTKCISIVEVCSARYTRYTNIIYIIFEVLAKRNKKRGAVVLNLTYFTIENKLKKKFFNLFMNHNQVDYSSLPSYFPSFLYIDSMLRCAFDRTALEVEDFL